MTDDNSALRLQLADQWQKLAIELIKKGLPADIIFESLLTVGLAGQVEVLGKEVAAARLAAIAEQLSEQVRQQKEALQEASNATKN
ncbi:hypothetical protein [Microvirga makkahensis]|uniref:Uncharacterized protein n=1 Tax=Microvirga makkahensis TaxID=1128670 RepID=A0A7X3SRK8_9HYPH|nr:hypothetical protein [Microvirga makkahensis]MXQ14179.1 hypothetical protein [Microvirga makkahensis]